MRLNKMTVALVLATLSVPVIAGPAPDDAEEPWRLSWEERMALRFDPETDTVRARGSAQTLDEATPSPRVVVIKGSRQPELFTGGELFNQLLSTGFAPDPRARAFWRQQYEKAGVPGAPESFWQRLEEVAAPILEIRERERRAIERWKVDGTPVTADWELPAPATQCQVRARGLAAARQEFTPQRFDRFLYQAVAPHMTVASSMNQSELEFVEAGCR